MKNTKEINIRFLKQGLIKTEAPMDLTGDELEEYCQEVLSNTSDEALIIAMHDIGTDSIQEYGVFNADSFQVECVEDSETFEKITQTVTWECYSEPEMFENIISENKHLGDYLEKTLGFTQEDVSNIANGGAQLFVVHVVCDNSLEEYEQFTTLEKAKEFKLEMCKKWYQEDGFENFKVNFEDSDSSEYDIYSEYYNSEEYFDACDNAKVTLEVK